MARAKDQAGGKKLVEVPKKKDEPGHAYMLFLCGGVLVSFTVFGYAQEAVTRSAFGSEKEKFSFTTFLVLLQSVGNAIVAAIILKMRHGNEVSYSGGVAPQDWLIAALAYLGAHEFGLGALKYIIFPLQVVCKSCKAVPVMFGEMILEGKQHKLSKKLSVLFMCSGVVCFTLFGGSKKGGGSEIVFDSNLAIGLGLVFGALVCDGIYGPFQGKIKQKAKEQGKQINGFHNMLNMNMWQGFFSLIICFLHGNEIASAFDFCKRHPDIIPALSAFAGAMAIGNVFIFNVQSDFDALTVTLTTTLRKLISVVFSVLWFGHSMQPAQWACVALVFLASPLSDKVALMIEGPPAAAPAPDKKDK
jgi:UDP-galactose transporter B1